LYKYQQEERSTPTTVAREEYEEKNEIVENYAEKQASKDGASESIHPMHEEWLNRVKFSNTLSASTYNERIEAIIIKKILEKKG